MRCTTSQIYF